MFFLAVYENVKNESILWKIDLKFKLPGQWPELDIATYHKECLGRSTSHLFVVGGYSTFIVTETTHSREPQQIVEAKSHISKKSVTWSVNYRGQATNYCGPRGCA